MHEGVGTTSSQLPGAFYASQFSVADTEGWKDFAPPGLTLDLHLAKIILGLSLWFP